MKRKKWNFLILFFTEKWEIVQTTVLISSTFKFDVKILDKKFVCCSSVVDPDPD
jgi:hypothetical protein